MNKSLFFGAIVLLLACTNENKTLTDADKEKKIDEAKSLISTIYNAAEICDPAKMTSTFYDSPDFVSLINGEYGNYEQTVKKYPTLMSDFKSQKPTILDEKYIVVDASTIVYTSKSSWVCILKNDSIAVFDNAGMQLILKKAHNNWKVLNWSEIY